MLTPEIAVLIQERKEPFAPDDSAGERGIPGRKYEARLCDERLALLLLGNVFKPMSKSLILLCAVSMSLMTLAV